MPATTTTTRSFVNAVFRGAGGLACNVAVLRLRQAIVSINYRGQNSFPTSIFLISTFAKLLADSAVIVLHTKLLVV